MAGKLAYLDASAYVKLLLREPEESALRTEMASWDGYVSSALLGTESIRACARHADGYAQDAREWLQDVALLPLDDAVLDAAAALRPAGLRSLDAIHLATAIAVRADLGAFIAYDARLCDAAAEYGLPVVRP